ncbi:hypothetical protein POX_b03319 [Penicillium oxalicum]|uniref:hypothetical protein n=1 Tax=Penicillium oxalicum TaxID=69781 RepID=UPI0020B7D24F|nr:hypothetical protein POX_b03319 [Penicillium oxalicum]KAI2793266.1 hypothetical protein POX_b03319 [Penicillium oxalicum]
MSRTPPRSINSAGSESNYSTRLPSLSPPGEHSASPSPAFSLDVNPFDTALPPIQSSQAPITHRRTGSTLKTVMRKIFNRKRQSQTDGVEGTPGETRFPPSIRLPEPIVGKSFLAAPSPPPSKCSSPLSEANLQIATSSCLSPTSLGSSSLVPAGLAPRPRRATLPSVIFSEDEESRYGVMSAVSDPQEDQSTISGRKSHQRTLKTRRRSRSIDSSHPLPRDPQKPSPSWASRTTSFPQMTPASNSRSPREENSADDQHIRRPSTGTTVTSQTRTSDGPSSPGPDMRPDRVSLLPDMANLVRAMQQDDSLTVEQRLNTIEVKMIDLEFAIARMQSSSASSTPVVDRSPGRDGERSSARRKQNSFPQVRNKASHSSTSDRDEQTPQKTRPPGPDHRPSSTSTVRAATDKTLPPRPNGSATAPGDFSGISIEQYSALVTLLRREQTARRNLEGQVLNLKKEIRQMQRAALQSMELGGTMYPIQKVDSQEFLRFRRALDGSECDSPGHFQDDKIMNNAFETESDYDPYGPPKWERERDRDKGRGPELKLGPPGKRLVTTAMI